MSTRMAVGALAALAVLAVPASAQWLDHKKAGVPRTADGKPDLNAPVPHTPDGKPDLSGVWLSDQWGPAGKRPNSPAAAKPEGPMMLPWAEKVFAERRANGGKDNPESRCMPQGIPYASNLPYPFEIVNVPGKVLVLYEMYSLRREIFTDGRELPKQFDSPSWMGYSVGKWDGDEFVVETAGFNDLVWNIDLAGHPHSDVERVIERFHRISYGYMDVQVTIDDPKTYAKRWVMPVVKYTMLPDTDLLEFVCEKNIDPQHMVGK